MFTHKHLVVLELPVELDLDDVREALEEGTGYIIKETEQKTQLKWLLANPYEGC